MQDSAVVLPKVSAIFEGIDQRCFRLGKKKEHSSVHSLWVKLKGLCNQPIQQPQFLIISTIGRVSCRKGWLFPGVDGLAGRRKSRAAPRLPSQRTQGTSHMQRGGGGVDVIDWMQDIYTRRVLKSEESHKRQRLGKVKRTGWREALKQENISTVNSNPDSMNRTNGYRFFVSGQRRRSNRWRHNSGAG